MPSERFMQQHYGPSGFVKRGTKFCARCHHPQDWHRLDDSKNISPTDPSAQFRCIGYDCEAPGKPKHDACNCPDFVESAQPVGSALYKDAVEEIMDMLGKVEALAPFDGRDKAMQPEEIASLEAILRRLFPSYQPVGSDKECICEGNWRQIVKEVEPLIGEKFRDEHGREFRFFGLVHGADDYYYGMDSKEHGMRLLSCVGNFDSWGMKQVGQPVGSADKEQQ